MQKAAGLEFGDRRRVPARFLAHGLHLPLGGISKMLPATARHVPQTWGAKSTSPRRGLPVDGTVGLDETIFSDFEFLQPHVVPGIAEADDPSPSMVYYRGGRAAVDSRCTRTSRGSSPTSSSAYSRRGAAVPELGCLPAARRHEPRLPGRPGPAARRRMGGDPAPGTLPTSHIDAALAGHPDGLTVTTTCPGQLRSSCAPPRAATSSSPRPCSASRGRPALPRVRRRRSGGFQPLRFVPKGKKVVLGLVTTKRPRAEGPADVLDRRIEEASRYVDVDRLSCPRSAASLRRRRATT